MADIGLSSGIVKDTLLFPTMDARAANVEQQRLIHNPTPEADSLMEHLRELAEHRSDRERVAAALTDLVEVATRLAESNRDEGSFELAVAGAADQLAHELRDAEQNGGAQMKLTAKALARRLRPALDLLLRPAGETSERERFHAYRAVSDVIRQTSRLRLLSDDVASQLRPRKYALLCELVEACEGATR